MIEILPAILSHTRADLMHKISQVPSAPALHIDLMDGRFVDNTTVGPDELDELPHNKIIEYHLMVREPIEWIRQLHRGKEKIFEVHVETLTGDGEDKLDDLLKAVKVQHGRLALAINPPTPIEKVEKLRFLRMHHPHLIIEVDGGVGLQTSPRAVAAGANRLAAANALFKAANPDEAYKHLKAQFHTP
jgi:ribulose-phosphate 3-epimerase